MSPGPSDGTDLRPYVPRVVQTWWRDEPTVTWRFRDGTAVLLDISGFTALTERLATRGKVGAEELSEVLDTTFAGLLEVAYAAGGSLLKWGGDAVLLLFEGTGHAPRAAAAAVRMQARLRSLGSVRTSAGRATLRMSVGVHTGSYLLVLAGDPAHHRELLVAGPDASEVVRLEAQASAGEVLISSRTADLLPPSCTAPDDDRIVLVSEPPDGAVGAWHEQSAAVPDDVDLRGVVSPRVREHLAEADIAGPEHRKVAVAFVGFSGSDDLLATHGPEGLARALDGLVRHVQRACAHHNVTFLETDVDDGGGKLMLVAGAPRSSGHDEDDLLRAMREVVDRPLELPVRVGVSRGSVFVGELGPPFARAYSVKGDVVNLAARLCSHAAPGELLAAEDVTSHATRAYETVERAPLVLKGKAAPVAAVSVGRRAADATTLGTVSGPLLGRDSELAAMRATLGVARSGHGRTIDLVGAAGIGKSRLVDELLRTEGAPAYLCRCDEYEADTPYRPFRTLLRSLLDVPPDAEDRAVATALREAADRHDPSSLPWLPLVAQVLDVEVPSTVEVEALADEFRAARLEAATAHLVARVLPRDSIVVFDDAQLMDEASAGLMEELRRAIAELPVLVILTRRDVAEGYEPRGDGIVTVRPGLLDATDASALVDELGAGALTPHEADTIRSRAGGNPLFLRGLVLAARTGASVAELPDTIEALVTSQIDRLPAAERTLLRHASVLGVAFHESELRDLLVGQQLPTGTASLERLAYFLRPEGRGRYRFEHQLVRDTAYEGLPYRRRRTLHGIAGDSIERRAGDPDEMAELLSLHFLQSARHDKAWRYSRVAGDRAAGKYAFVQAQEMYGRAVAAAHGLASIPDRDLSEVLVALGDAQYWTGRQAEALVSFRRARALVRDDLVSGASLLRREAEIVHRQGRSSAALRTVTRALNGLGSTEVDQLVVRSRLERLYAKIRESQGRYADALRWARLAEEHSGASGDLTARAESLEIVMVALSMLGRSGTQNYGRQALALYEQLDDRVGQSRTLNNLAVSAWMRGQGRQALDMFERAAQLADEAGDTVGVAETRYNIADTLVRLGRAAEAARLLRSLLPAIRSSGAEDFQAAALRALGLATVLDGDVESGLAMLSQARDRFGELGEAAEVTETEAAIAHAHLTAGDPAQTLTVAREAVARARELDAGQLLPWLERLRGAALADSGDLVAAREALHHGLALAEEHGKFERGFLLAELSGVERRSGDRSEADELLALSEEAFDELGFVGSPRYPRIAG